MNATSQNPEPLPIKIRHLLNLADVIPSFKQEDVSGISLQAPSSLCVKIHEGNSTTFHLLDPERPTETYHTTLSDVDSTIVHPTRRLLALRAKGKLQLVDPVQKRVERSAELSNLSFWRWLNQSTLGIVTKEAIYHWSLNQPHTDPPRRVAEVMNGFEGFIIRDYKVSANEKWGVVLGFISKDDKIEGKMLLYSFERNGSQVIDGHAGSFAEIGGSLWFCYCVAEGESITLIVVAVEGAEKHVKKQKKLDIEVKDDVPLSAHIGPNGILFITTQFGYIHVMNILTMEYRALSKFIETPIFTSCDIPEGGFVGITTTGQVIKLTYEETPISVVIVPATPSTVPSPPVSSPSVPESPWSEVYQHRARLVEGDFSLNGVKKLYDKLELDFPTQCNEQEASKILVYLLDGYHRGKIFFRNSKPGGEYSEKNSAKLSDDSERHEENAFAGSHDIPGSSVINSNDHNVLAELIQREVQRALGFQRTATESPFSSSWKVTPRKKPTGGNKRPLPDRNSVPDIRTPSKRSRNNDSSKILLPNDPIPVHNNHNVRVGYGVVSSSITVANILATKMKKRNWLHNQIWDKMDQLKFAIKNERELTELIHLVLKAIEEPCRKMLGDYEKDLVEAVWTDVKEITIDKVHDYLYQSRGYVSPSPQLKDNGQPKKNTHRCNKPAKTHRDSREQHLGPVTLGNFEDHYQCEMQWIDVTQWKSNWEMFLSRKDVGIKKVRKDGAAALYT